MSLSLEGDLSFTVDGPGGTTSGRVVGDGAVLRVHADDPVAAWEATVGSVSTGPAGLRAAADALAEQGLSVEVAGPHGRLALVGADADSGFGRLVTGSRRVQFGRPVALRPLAVAQVRQSLPPRRRAVLALAVLAALVALGRRLSRA